MISKSYYNQIVEGGPEVENLKKMIKRLEAESYIQFSRFNPHNEIYKYMQIAHVFVSVYDVSDLCNPVLE